MTNTSVSSAHVKHRACTNPKGHILCFMAFQNAKEIIQKALYDFSESLFLSILCCFLLEDKELGVLVKGLLVHQDKN